MSKSKKVNFTRRQNGEGSVYKINDGRYGAAISLGKDANGKRLRHVETGKTEQEVIDKMRLWLAKNGKLEKEEIVINGQTPVEEFVNDFKINALQPSRISDVTFENYSYALKHFQEYFKGKKIGMIDVDEINRFFSWMIDSRKEDGTYKYSKATLDLTVYLINRMFKRAVKRRYLLVNPMEDKELIEISSNKKTQEITALTQAERSILKDALVTNKVVYPVIALMSVTGMRTQEALGLQWGDIDFENATINIHQAITEEIIRDNNGNKISSKTILGPTKRGKSDRLIAVPDMVINILKEWRETAPTVSKTELGEKDFVFGNSKSPTWTYAGFRSSVNSTLKRSGIGMDSLRLHRLRHTVATMMSDEPDANVHHIMQLLGHTQIKTAQKYIDKRTQERAKKNKELMGRLSEKCGLLD